MMGNNFIQQLTSEALKLEQIRTEIKTLENTRKQKVDQLRSDDEAWEKSRTEFIDQVNRGIISTGDPINDHVFTQSSFYGAVDFQETFNNNIKKLTSSLDLISQTKTFWNFTKEGYGPNQPHIYELSFLKDTPYTISPSQLTFHRKSSILLRVEPVFLNQAVWPFITQDDSEKDFQVKPEGVTAREYQGDIQFTNNQARVHTLEGALENNPLVLEAFKFQAGYRISPDLQEKITQQQHMIAEQALKIIKNEYEKVKLNDEEIQKIEEKYNPDNVNSGECSRIPQMVAESDPFLARLNSYDARTNRDRALKGLAGCIDDLDRTGLANYTSPIENRLMEGETIVSNLSKVSNYIRNILEIRVKAIEVKMNPQTAK